MVGQQKGKVLSFPSMPLWGAIAFYTQSGYDALRREMFEQIMAGKERT
jgi:hypothetical protein